MSLAVEQKMADARFAAELARYGPQRSGGPAPTPSLADARAYCRRLAQSHYENFTVASWLLPRRLRPHFYSVYAYCRWADDLADETGNPAQSLELLDWWEQQLRDCYRGEATHPVFVALKETTREFAIPPEPFLDLLSAFRQDQRITRYETFADLLGYCRRSANPVGRLVLYLGRCYDDERGRLADSVCTGLQLVNFWQDVARDFDRGRIYLPQESCRRFGYDEAAFARREATPAFRQLLQAEIDRAEEFLATGWPLVRLVPRELELDVALFIRGGLAIVEAIRQQGDDVWSRRPVVSKARKVRLLVGELARRATPLPLGEGRVRANNSVLEGSYALCGQLARRAASNFYFSFLLLPHAKRQAMCALYAFLRRTDDLGDNPSPAAARRQDLEQWRARLARALQGTFDEPIFPAVVDTLAQHQIPPEYLSAVIDGVEMDLDHRQYETFADLAAYCHRVASVVGQACVHIWGYTGGQHALDLAAKCGLAFQLTNILRDLTEDAGQGRVYLPQEDLRRFNYLADDLRHGVADERFTALMNFQIERTERLYEEGAALEPLLSRDGRRVFAAMTTAYRSLLKKIKRRPAGVFESRVRLSMGSKVVIAAKALASRK